MITLFEMAIAYIVFGIVGWVAMSKFVGFFLGGGAGMVVVGAALWLARRRKRKVEPPAS